MIVPQSRQRAPFQRLHEFSLLFLVQKIIHKNFVVSHENCHWLKLMYLFLTHVVLTIQ
jgi:hypothetical protein